MKDISTIWNGIVGRKYDAVNTESGDSPRHTQKAFEIKEKAKRRNKRRRALIFALLGIGMVLSGLCILYVDPYKILYEWKLIFSPGGEIYSLWETPPVKLYLKVYLWNITNKDEYMSGVDKKLKFQEVGPYVYREMMSHENVTFNDNGTLTAHPSHPLVWDPELSGERKEDDLLILPNIALLSIADVVSKQPFYTQMGLNFIIRQTKSQPLVQMTAKEFMFGYQSALMNLGYTFMPSWIYFDKLGLIDRMYEFRGDYETIYTGTKFGLSNIGLIDTYNGDKKMLQWEYPCGNISGASDGTMFQGNIKLDDKLLFFRKSVCRPKELIRVNETNVNGLNAYVYHFANDSDDNGHVYEKNRCYCKEATLDKCLPKGLLDVGGCYYGFPIALSYPHFFEGDPALFDKVESGLNPDPEKHRSVFVIQPESGLPLKVAVKYQINLALGNLQRMANSEKFSNMILPLLWTENGMAELPSNLNMRFKIYIEILPKVQTCLMYISFAAGIVLVIYSILRLQNTGRNHKSNFHSNWIEDDLVMNIDRKLSSYIPEKRSSLTPKQLEVYFDSLVAPLNQSIDYEKETN